MSRHCYRRGNRVQRGKQLRPVSLGEEASQEWAKCLGEAIKGLGLAARPGWNSPWLGSGEGVCRLQSREDPAAHQGGSKTHGRESWLVVMGAVTRGSWQGIPKVEAWPRSSRELSNLEHLGTGTGASLPSPEWTGDNERVLRTA